MMLKVKQAQFRIEALRGSSEPVTDGDLDIIEAALNAVLDAYAEQSNVIQKLNTTILDQAGKLLDAEAELEELKKNKRGN